MSNFSREELMDMIFVLGETDKNCLLASKVYKAKYPERARHPREETLKNLLNRFAATGSVDYRLHERAKNETNEENEFRVMTAVVENPQIGGRQLSEDLLISRTSIRRLLRKNKFHPFHIQLHHELREGDFQRRENFCTWMRHRLNENQDFLRTVMFSDESTFHKNGYVNKHNMHYYADENPHFLRMNYSQQRWSLNVWAGIMGSYLIGPFFFERTLNGVVYHSFIENNLRPLMQHIPPETTRNMYFQQDGAPPHYDVNVRALLDNTFPNKWIGRGGPVSWPARSPDITPLDFFLWGYIKGKVYREPPSTAEDMKDRIRAEWSAGVFC